VFRADAALDQVHAASVAAAKAAASKGDWVRALPLYERAISDGRADALWLRVHRLPGFFALSQVDRLEAELKDLQSENLGELKPVVLLHQADWLMCCNRRQEGQQHIRNALAGREHLAPGQGVYARALTAATLSESIKLLHDAHQLNPLNSRIAEVYLFSLVLAGDLENAATLSRTMRGLFPDHLAPDFFEALMAILETGKRSSNPAGRPWQAASNGPVSGRRRGCFSSLTN
jgi:hypothetical protein